MQTFTITLHNTSTQDSRDVLLEAACVELAHKDGYFQHAEKYEEIISIADESGDILYTEEGGFSTMPQEPPTEILPTGNPFDTMPGIEDEPGTFPRESENVNFF